MTGRNRTILGAALVLCPVFASAQELDLRISLGGDDLRAEVTAALSVASLLDSESATPQSLLAAAQADYARVVAALYSDGRFGPSVSIQIDGREVAGISPFEAPSSIRTILVEVDPGPRFKFGRAEIGPLADGTEIPEGYQIGKRAETGVISEATTAGVTGWRNVGHPKARLADQRIAADHPNEELDVSLTLAPGPRLRFGDVVVTGNDRTSRTRIREIAAIPQGEVFDPEEITDAERRLRQTGVFNSVAVSEADAGNEDGTLDLALQVAEQAPRRFGFGAQVSTEEGGEISAFWLHRNLFHGAERLRLDAEMAGIGGTANGNGVNYTLQLTYGRPATFTPDTDFFLTAAIERLDEPGYLSNQASVAAGLSHRISEELEGSFSLGYRYIDAKDAFGHRNFSMLTASLGATYDTRDNELNPTRGFYLEATGTPFLGLQDTKSGVRFTSDARTYYGVGEDNRFVLAGRAQLGSVWGPSLSETVPDDLFYSGGGGTVRGQKYESLGVTLDNGDFTGGQSFAGLSAEVRAQVRDNIGLVGFYDAGFITDNSGFGGESDWHAGAGVGLRYGTGIGPIRVDIATPANGDDKGKNVEIYIGIGQAF